MATVTFSSLGLNADITKGLGTKGYKEPTAIQKNALPPFMEGADCRVHTPNGDEATALVAATALQKVDAGTKNIQVVVLTRSRETTEATMKFIVDVAGSLKIDCYAVKIGVGASEEKAALAKGPHIVIGTPSRVSTARNLGSLDLENLKLLVIEQASDTLDQEGATDGTYNVIQKSNPRKQIIMITPTLSDKVKYVCQREIAARYNVDKDEANYKSMYEEEEGMGIRIPG